MTSATLPNHFLLRTKRTKKKWKSTAGFCSARLWLGTVLAVSMAGCTEAILIDKIEAGHQHFEGISYFLPKGIVEITIKSDVKLKQDGAAIPDTRTVLLSVDTLRYVPDPEHQYQVTIVHNALYADDISVSVDDKLLLKSINSINEDKLPEIIQRIAQAPKEIAGAAALQDTTRVKRFDIKFSIDPTSSIDIARLEAHLARIDPKIRFRATPFVDTKRLVGGSKPDCAEHICFRTAMPYRLELYTQNDSEVQVVASQIVVLPNKYVLGHIPIRRAPFVKKELSMVFTSGMLTSVQLKNPSEVRAFIEIPISVAKAIVSIPSAMLQFQTTQIVADNNLLTAQQKNLDLQRQIIDTQQKLLLAQASREP